MFLAAYDGSTLSTAALSRATWFSDALGHELFVVTVVPRDPRRARDVLNPSLSDKEVGNGDEEEVTAPTTEEMIEDLKGRIESIAPGATFVRIDVPRNATDAQIAEEIKEFARQEGALVVFVGSTSTGPVAGLGSVAENVVGGEEFDVYVSRKEW